MCLLISHRVRFLVVGGHAVAGHGEPRLTEDLDVFVDREPGNAKRLRDALVDFGFGAAAPQLKELSRSHKVFMLGRKPWCIDILTRIVGVCASSSVPPASQYQLWSCSAAQLQKCEQYWCSNCTWTTGDCP